MPNKLNDSLLEYLSSFLTQQRRELFRTKVAQRTRYLTVVIEDIFQSHNISAVLRSCECFGVQDVHIIENNYPYQISQQVAMGSSKWLNLSRYSEAKNNSQACMHALTGKGYTMVATTPHEHGYSIANIPLDKPLALWFGTEKEGLSSFVLENADRYVTIPTFGFTESLNISVSAAICLQILTSRLRNEGLKWQLSPQETVDVMLEWTKRTVKRADLLELEFIRQYDLKE